MTVRSGGQASRGDVVRQLHTLGVEEGDILLVHSSFRALRPVDGGPKGVVEALFEAVGASGTVVMPSWGGDDSAIFDRWSTPVARDLGIVAETFRTLPGVIRSDHSQAFAATGPDAEFITGDSLPLPPHIPESPVGRVHDLDGKILLLGVGHDANSTVHLAELLSGARYGVQRECTVLENGVRTRVSYLENDHCCARFQLVDQWLREEGLQREGPVGSAHSRLVGSRDVVRAATDHLSKEPLIFLHEPSVGCAECDEARRALDSDL